MCEILLDLTTEWQQKACEGQHYDTDLFRARMSVADVFYAAHVATEIKREAKNAESIKAILIGAFGEPPEGVCFDETGFPYCGDNADGWAFEWVQYARGRYFQETS